MKLSDFLAGLVAAARQHDDGDTLFPSADRAQQIEALDVGKPEIEDDQIRLLREQLYACFSVRSFQHVIALGVQAHAQQLPDRRLVVDHQYLEARGAHAAVSNGLVSAGIGRRMVNTAPERSPRLEATIVPLMASIKPREIARPRPVPART